MLRWLSIVLSLHNVVVMSLPCPGIRSFCQNLNLGACLLTYLSFLVMPMGFFASLIHFFPEHMKVVHQLAGYTHDLCVNGSATSSKSPCSTASSAWSFQSLSSFQKCPSCFACGQPAKRCEKRRGAGATGGQCIQTTLQGNGHELRKPSAFGLNLLIFLFLLP